MEKNYNYLIVGAGISGAVFANEASKKGKTCLVIDRRSTIGGNCHQELVGDILMHCYGAHIFRTNNKAIWDYVQSFGQMLPFMNTPLGKYKDDYYNLPINMNTFKQLWGVTTPSEARQKVEKERMLYDNPQNLEEWVLSSVGQEIYDIFIKGYTEKQWGKRCSELPQSVMKRIPIRYEYNNNYYNELYQGVPAVSYDQIIANMLDSSYIDVLLNTKFNIAQFGDIATDGIIYTGALDELYNYEYGTLEWRGLEFEHKVYFTDNYQGVGVVNHLDKYVPYTRTIEHVNLKPKPIPINREYTIVTEEYPDEWFIGKEPYYPIITDRNIELQAKYVINALSDGITPLGRLGCYRYYSMDEAIEDALACAEQELGDNNGKTT